MNLLQKIFGGKETPSTQKSFSGNPGDWQSFLGGDLMNNTMSVNKAVKDLIWVCIDKRAETVSSLAFELVKAKPNGEVLPLENHDVLDLINKPNRGTTKENFLYTIVAQLDIVGEVFIRIKKEKGLEDKLFIIPTKQVEKIMSVDGLEVTAYRIMALQGQFYTVGLDEMVEIKNPSMFGGVSGDGLVEKNIDVIDIQHTMATMHKTMLQKGAILSGIIETDYDDQDKIEMAKYGFKQKYEGLSNAYETPVLPEGYHYKDIKGQNAKDMDFANMDKAYMQKVLDLFGVPKEILGNLDGKGVANGSNAHRSFMEFTIKPIVLQIVSQLNEFLLPNLTKDPIWFSIENIVPLDQSFELDSKKASLSGNAWKTINEVREAEGLEALEGGDEIPSNAITIDMGDDEDEIDEGDDNDDDTKKSYKSQAIKQGKSMKSTKKAIEGVIREKKIKHNIPHSAKKSLNLAIHKQGVIDTTVESLMENIHEINHKSFITRNDENSKKVEKIVEAVDEKMRKMVIKNMRSKKSLVTKADMNNLFSEKLAVDEMEKDLEKLLVEIAVAEGIKEMALIPAINQYNPKSESLIKEVKRVLRLHSVSYTDTTAKQLTKKLTKAGAEGLTTYEMETVASGVFKQDFRHKRIGQNLTYAIANKGSLDAYRQSGVVTTKVWRTAEDEKVCGLCGPMNGKEIPLNENFFDAGTSVTVGKETWKFLDHVEAGFAHPHCRCKITAGHIE